jgi:hypothetical protein
MEATAHEPESGRSPVPVQQALHCGTIASRGAAGSPPCSRSSGAFLPAPADGHKLREVTRKVSLTQWICASEFWGAIRAGAAIHPVAMITNRSH